MAPVSGSTSTSQIWVANETPAPSATISLWPAIGPPVLAAAAAISLSESGGRLPCSFASRFGVAVLPDDVVDGNIPHLCGSLAQHADGVSDGEDRRHRRRKRAAAAVGRVVVSQCPGIGDHGLDLVIGDAEFLRRHQRKRGA